MDNRKIARSNQNSIREVAKLLRQSQNVLFITGAGMSAESGVPTYRGVAGLYDDKSTEDGISIEEALSVVTLAEHPATTWKYLNQIGSVVRSAKHHRGHEIIALIERELDRVLVLTQNVDGFHRDGGSINVVEAHGNMNSIRCSKCEYATDQLPEDLTNSIPRCPDCDSVLRPDVVLFGELISGQAIDHLQRELALGFDLVFSIGTSSVFPYIQEPIRQAVSNGVATVEINPSSSQISSLVQYHLQMPASEALIGIWEAFQCLR